LHVEAEEVPEKVPAEQSAHCSSTDSAEFLYLPGTHATHEVLDEAPTVSEVLPASHSVQLVLPASSEYVRGGQGIHVAIDTAPAVVENVPATHSVHDAGELDPSSVEYFPGVQLVQRVLPASEYVPAPHVRQLKLDVAPVAIEYVPPPQLMQDVFEDAPVEARYLPPRQFAHAVALGPSEYFPAPHSKHAAADAAPRVKEYVPATHPVHVVTDTAPVTVEYVPAGHSTQYASALAASVAIEYGPTRAFLVVVT
jgi:hypothetical protein